MIRLVVRWTLSVALVLATRVASADEAALTPDACASTAEHAADLRDGGHLRDARASFAICAEDGCPRIVREDCRRGLQAINDGGPHLVPRVRDAAGHDVLDVELLLDAAPLPADVRLRGILVDPGTHVARARRAGQIVAEVTVVVAAEDGRRTVDLTLAAAPRANVERRRMLPWIVAGAGAGALVIGGALGTWTYLDYRSLKRECGPDCTPSRVDPVHTRGVVADVVMGVGLVIVVAGVVLGLTERTPTAPRTAVLSW